MSNGVRVIVKDEIGKINKKMAGEFEKRMLKAAMRLHQEVTKTLTGSRSGREYKVPATDRTYKASQPNEPPATRLGHLRKSYKYIVKGEGLKAVGYVGSPLEYSHYLEYGTAKMKPRPHLKPALETSKKDIMKLFEDLVE